jgi:hypothetical protein
MPKFIRHDDNQRAPSRWAVSIFVGATVACLFGFIASYPKVALWVSHAAQAELAGAVTLGSEPSLIATKKPVRYEAVIANWKRHPVGNGT